MGRSKVKFNISDIFMEGQNSVVDRNLFVASPLFGIFAALYNRSNGKVKVGKLETVVGTNNIHYIKKVFVVNRFGLQVCSINNSTWEYSDIFFSVNHTPLNSPHFVMTPLRTTNPKYMQSKLAKNSAHDAAVSFDGALHRAEQFFGDQVRSTMVKAVDDKFGGFTEREGFNIRRSLPDSAINFLAKYFMGHSSELDMRPQDRTLFDSVYKKYLDTVSKFKAALKDTYDMVCTEKWVYVTNVNGGVILGAIRPEPMAAALDIISNGDNTTLPSEISFNYVRESMPIKWYPSYDCIPSDTREQLEFSMVMLKTHLGSAKSILENAGDHVFHEIGCRYMQGSDGDSQFFFLTK